MEGDQEFQLNAKRLKELGQKKLTMEEKKVRARARQPFVDVLACFTARVVSLRN